MHALDVLGHWFSHHSTLCYWIGFLVALVWVVYETGKIWADTKDPDTEANDVSPQAEAEANDVSPQATVIVCLIVGTLIAFAWPIVPVVLLGYGVFKLGSRREFAKQRLRARNKALEAEIADQQRFIEKIAKELEESTARALKVSDSTEPS